MSLKISNYTPIFAIFLAFANCLLIYAQPAPNRNAEKQKKVRTVTIPISILSKEEIKEKQPSEIIEAGNIFVKENNEDQEILSIRSVSNSPLEISILIQEDISSTANLQLKQIAAFVRRLPKETKVFVGYLRGNGLQTRQKFTSDIEKAADSIRNVAGLSSLAPANLFDAITDGINRFDGLPNGRRAILVLSDGLDTSRGIEGSDPTQNVELDRAIGKAQKRGIAIYSFYASASETENGDSKLILNGQGSLNKLSDQTGGRAFFQGTISPLNYESFLRQLSFTLNRQFAITYLSTHLKKGYYKVQVISTNPDIKILAPSGYFYK